MSNRSMGNLMGSVLALVLVILMLVSTGHSGDFYTEQAADDLRPATASAGPGSSQPQVLGRAAATTPSML